MKHVLVTGGNGFLGHSLCEVLSKCGLEVRATVRDEKSKEGLPPGVSAHLTGRLEEFRNWSSLLEGIDTVVHLAAHVHQMKRGIKEEEQVYQKVNQQVTKDLAEASVRMGVRRFLFLSSVKAMGESTHDNEIWNENSPCLPKDGYGSSKHLAELSLLEIGRCSRLEMVILRSPLIYGPGVKANFVRLLRVVYSGVPLPFANLSSRRSFIFVDNLVNAMMTCATHPDASGNIYLVSDGEDVSSSELIKRIGIFMNRPARLYPFPISMLSVAGKIIGKSMDVNRLTDSLRIDIGKIQRELSWKAPYNLDEGLKQTVAWYLETKKIRK